MRQQAVRRTDNLPCKFFPERTHRGYRPQPDPAETNPARQTATKEPGDTTHNQKKTSPAANPTKHQRNAPQNHNQRHRPRNRHQRARRQPATTGNQNHETPGGRRDTTSTPRPQRPTPDTRPGEPARPPRKKPRSGQGRNRRAAMPPAPVAADPWEATLPPLAATPLRGSFSGWYNETTRRGPLSSKETRFVALCGPDHVRSSRFSSSPCEQCRGPGGCDPPGGGSGAEPPVLGATERQDKTRDPIAGC